MSNLLSSVMSRRVTSDSGALYALNIYIYLYLISEIFKNVKVRSFYFGSVWDLY